MINLIKLFLILALSFIFHWDIFGQDTLKIEACYALAKENYPLTRQLDLLEKTEEYTIKNINNTFLPKLSIRGQATYQSEVTELPFEQPDVPVQKLSKDQYKIYGEVQQELYDGGTARERKGLQRAGSLEEEAKIETELYQLKERINQLFFGILLLDENIRQAALVEADIETGMRKVRAGVASGMVLKSELKRLEARLLAIEQRLIGYQANRESYLNMLSAFINRGLSTNTIFERPYLQTTDPEINRPELTLFNYQRQHADARHGLINANNRPKVDLFLQGGYGRPTLNFLDNNFSIYYIGGVRLNWPLSGIYTSKEDHELIKLTKEAINVQQAIFLFNTQLSLTRKRGEILRLRRLIQNDAKIIVLRKDIKESATSQLDNAAITVNDYLDEVNAEDQAKQQQLLHKVQLLMAQYQYNTIAGN